MRHGLTLTAAWTRSTPPGAAAGAGYLTISNKGGRPDRLLGGSSPAAREVQVHEMRIENGIARMHPVEGGLAIVNRPAMLTPFGADRRPKLTPLN